MYLQLYNIETILLCEIYADLGKLIVFVQHLTLHVCLSEDQVCFQNRSLVFGAVNFQRKDEKRKSIVLL